MVAVVLCPGQGAQRVGMGKDLADRFPAARDTFAAIDDALGVALSRIMWDGPESELTLTHNAQPAILAHTAAVYAVLGNRLGDLKAAAGHSLGEYSAYVVAGALTPADAARLVRRRGELMYEAGLERPGAMAAVMGLESANVETACEQASNGGVAVVANLNALDQVVISGDPDAVQRAGEHCKTAGAKRVIPLKVSGAFHSPLMAPAVPGLEQALVAVSFADPSVPVVANATAREIRTGDQAREQLTAQLTAPVRWVESMRRAAELAGGGGFLELGPGRVLSGLLKRILPGTEARALGTAQQIEEFLA